MCIWAWVCGEVGVLCVGGVDVFFVVVSVVSIPVQSVALYIWSPSDS